MEQINFAIDEAVRQLRQSLRQIKIEDSFHNTLTRENTDVPQSSAALYLQRLTQQANLSAILIITDMTICLIAHGANVVMFDSHLHGNFGALIASTTVENTENFLKAVKEMISPTYNIQKYADMCGRGLSFSLRVRSIGKSGFRS